MNLLSEQSLKNIALEHNEYIPVLERYNLDFCCKGGKTLKEACFEKNISVDSILADFEINNNKKQVQMPFSEMNAEQLISYILIHHHFYVKNAIPTILNHLGKVVSKHGERHPYIKEVIQLFEEVAEELIAHMQKEEQVLFPRIKKLFNSELDQNTTVTYINAPVQVMEEEHENAGAILYKIRAITSNYNAPENACTTHKICLSELKEFEEDLHRHVHLENNILFPMASKKIMQLGINL
jgi:regulator of cell morphogenesis and NO signaling